MRQRTNTNSKKKSTGPLPPLSVPNDDADFDILADVTTPSKTGWWRPLHPLFIVAMIPLCPSWFFLNRGFTQWFHWGIIFYYMTGKKDWWLKFLIVQGGGVCAGWYSAVVFEYFNYGRLCHLLYNNMPQELREVYLTDGKLASGGIITDNVPALVGLALTHLIDFLAHPVLTYVMWKIHKSRGGTLRSILLWDILSIGYVYTRFYSCVHWYFNDGVLGLWYIGYDVYNIDNTESYVAAYIGESLFFLALACYKFYLKSGKDFGFNIRIGNFSRRRRRPNRLSPKQLAKLCIEDKQQKPQLIQSESCFSNSTSTAES